MADHFSFIIIHVSLIFISVNKMDEDFYNLKIAIRAAKNVNDIHFLICFGASSVDWFKRAGHRVL